VYGGWKL